VAEGLRQGFFVRGRIGAMDPNPYESPRSPSLAVAVVASPWVRFPLAVVCVLIALFHILAMAAWILRPDRSEPALVVGIAFIACSLGAAGFTLIAFGLLAKRGWANVAGLAMVAAELLIECGFVMSQ